MVDSLVIENTYTRSSKQYRCNDDENFDAMDRFMDTRITKLVLAQKNNKIN